MKCPSFAKSLKRRLNDFCDNLIFSICSLKLPLSAVCLLCSCSMFSPLSALCSFKCGNRLRSFFSNWDLKSYIFNAHISFATLRTILFLPCIFKFRSLGWLVTSTKNTKWKSDLLSHSTVLTLSSLVLCSIKLLTLFFSFQNLLRPESTCPIEIQRNFQWRTRPPLSNCNLLQCSPNYLPRILLLQYHSRMSQSVS